MNCFVLNPLPSKRHMTFFREQIELRVVPKKSRNLQILKKLGYNNIVNIIFVIFTISLFCKGLQFQSWCLYCFCFKYINVTIKSSSKYCSYHRKVAEWDLSDKPKPTFKKHLPYER